MDVERLVVGAAKVVTVIVLVAAIAIFGAYWWARTPPKRPHGVSANAVWLWAPAVGVPSPKRGMWVGCMVNPQDKRPHCQMNDKNGRLRYEGVFASQTAKKSTRDAESMEIDVAKMGFELSVFIDEELVPLVVLKNGEVLIPAVAFDRGLEILNSHQRP
jgi:hypothetical protein